MLAFACLTMLSRLRIQNSYGTYSISCSVFFQYLPTTCSCHRRILQGRHENVAISSFNYHITVTVCVCILQFCPIVFSTDTRRHRKGNCGTYCSYRISYRCKRFRCTEMSVLLLLPSNGMHCFVDWNVRRLIGLSVAIVVLLLVINAFDYTKLATYIALYSMYLLSNNWFRVSQKIKTGQFPNLFFDTFLFCSIELLQFVSYLFN